MVRINFQNNITKANADTFNTMQDNIETAIDTNTTNINALDTKVDRNATYSTDEVVVGTFMGKPLYRKVYESSTYSTQINLAISNIDKITNIVGLIKRNDYDIWQYLPSRLDNAGFSAQFGNLQYTSSNLAINLSLGTSWSSSFSRIIITLEYTKTTD